jgi:hypothetical protein
VKAYAGKVAARGASQYDHECRGKLYRKVSEKILKI